MSARRHTAAVALLLVGGALLAGSATAADFTGKWLALRPSAVIRTLDGGEPPLLPRARARRAAAPAARGAALTDDDPVARCIPPGIPRVYDIAAPFLVLQRPQEVMVVHQFQRLVRLVYLVGKAPRDPDPAFLGNSVAHWDGDTLVIATAGFKADGRLDESGTPFSTALRVTEHWRLRDARTLEIIATIDDPQNYATAWRTRYVFRRQSGTEIDEDVCADRTWPEHVQQQERMERAP